VDSLATSGFDDRGRRLRWDHVEVDSIHQYGRNERRIEGEELWNMGRQRRINICLYSRQNGRKRRGGGRFERREGESGT
jgi:hypothetical protein